VLTVVILPSALPQQQHFPSHVVINNFLLYFKIYIFNESLKITEICRNVKIIINDSKRHEQYRNGI